MVEVGVVVIGFVAVFALMATKAGGKSPATGAEPGMEDILSSIRTIIDEDDRKKGVLDRR